MPTNPKQIPWHTPQHHSGGNRAIPGELKTWLLDSGSLTKKLVAIAGKGFRVKVLKQVRQKPKLSEARLLGQSHHRHAIIREVILYNGERPWVFARTVIPLSSLKGSLGHLHYLGTRPLGEAIFAEPSLQRKAIEIAPILGHHVPVQQPVLKPMWGRRSLFVVKNKPLLVAELFLETLLSDARKHTSA